MGEGDGARESLEMKNIAKFRTAFTNVTVITIVEDARFPVLLLQVLLAAASTKGLGHVEEKSQIAEIPLTASVLTLTGPEQAVVKEEATAVDINIPHTTEWSILKRTNGEKFLVRKGLICVHNN